MQNGSPDGPDVFRDRSDGSPAKDDSGAMTNVDVIGTRAFIEKATRFVKEK
jgi:hypothetical protein